MTEIKNKTKSQKTKQNQCGFCIVLANYSWVCGLSGSVVDSSLEKKDCPFAIEINCK